MYCSVLQCLADKCIHILCVFRETVDPAVVETTKHFYMFLCVAVCCSLFECIAVSRRYKYTHSIFWCKTVDPAVVEMANHFCMLQRVAACCSVLQRVAACCSVLQRIAVCCSVLQCVACVAVCCIVLQCLADIHILFLYFGVKLLDYFWSITYVNISFVCTSYIYSHIHISYTQIYLHTYIFLVSDI